MTSRPGVFQFVIFLSVALSPSGCVFTWGPSSSIRNSVSMLFIHSAFFYLSDPICFSKIFLPLLHLVVDMVSHIHHLIVGRIFFRCFGTSRFVYIVWSWSRYLLSLPSLAIIFWLVSSTFFRVLVVVLFQFRPKISKCSVLVFLFVIVVFLSVIQVWVPAWVLTFCLWSSKRPWFFHKLILLLRILNRLTPWCRLSGYLSISCSFSRVRTWLSSSLGSWEKAIWFSFQTWFL